MKRSRNRNSFRIAVFASVLAVVLGLIVFAPTKFESASGTRAARTSSSRFALTADRDVRAPMVGTPALKSMANFPLAFEVNAGQAEPSVKFLARVGKSELLLTSHSVVVQSRKSFGVKFAGSNAANEPQGIDALPGQRNYIIGNDPARWHTQVPTFRKVIYEDIYPGIDLTFYGNQSEFEYDFVVKPGVDPHAIHVGIEGARPQISAAGDLILKSGADELIQRKPSIYQDFDG